MKKVMDKLFNLIKFDKKYVFLSLVIVIVGIIFGSLFIVLLSKNDKNLIIEYIQEFINSINNNSFNYIETFKNTILVNLILIIAMVVLGFSCILVPINVLILFYKAFVIGFSISGFILTFKIKGLLLSIIYIFPHIILNILILAILTAFTLKLSLNTIKSIIKKKKIKNGLYIQKYIFIFIMFIVLVSITSIYESFITPYLLKKIISFI